ncbi:MAG: hypothetical protein ACR2NX_02840 [Chthoniobacterales bacterium]
MDRPFQRRHAFAFFAFLFTLTLRLVTLGQLTNSPYALPVTSDMKFYADWGGRIASGELTDFHAFYGEPLYAYFLGGIFALGGFAPFWAGLLQSLLDAVTALLIFKIAVQVFPDRRRGIFVGLLAAIGWALYVPAAAYCGLVIPTAWVAACWWFVVWWMLRRSVQARWVEWFALAFLIGLVAMISAATLFLLPLAAAGAILHRRGGAALALVAGLALGTAPAWAHNVFIAHDPVFISAHGGLNFWIGNNPEANGYPKIPSDLPSDQALLLEESIRLAEKNAGGELPRSEVSRYWSRKAWNYITSHPGAWLALEGVKLKNFWSSFAYDDLSSITPLRDAGIIPPGIQFGLLAAFGLPGVVFAFRNRKARWIIAALGLQMVALLPVFVNERYRESAAPGLLLLAAFFVAELWRNLFARRWLPLLTMAALLLLSTILVTRPPTDPSLRSVNDFKAGRRQLIAGDFDHAVQRLHLAAAAVVPARQVIPLVAELMGEFAHEKWKAGEPEIARRALKVALRVDPADEKLLRLSSEMKADGAAN